MSEETVLHLGREHEVNLPDRNSTPGATMQMATKPMNTILSTLQRISCPLAIGVLNGHSHHGHSELIAVEHHTRYQHASISNTMHVVVPPEVTSTKRRCAQAKPSQCVGSGLHAEADERRATRWQRGLNVALEATMGHPQR